MSNSKRQQENSRKHLSIGEMARLNGVSEKTLRLYHRRGLVEPAFVDEETGYRFYSLSQSVTIDVIRHMQQMGFSLNEIGDIIHRDDPDTYRSLMVDKLDHIEQEIARLTQGKRVAERYIASLDILADHPPVNEIMVEHRAPQRIMRLGIFNPRIREADLQGDELMYEWELHLRGVRSMLEERGLPATMLYHVGTLTSRESLNAGRYIIDDTFVFVNRTMGSVFDECGEDMPGGDYLTMYYDSLIDKNGRYATPLRIHQIEQWAEEHGLELEGDCYGIDLADTSHLDHPRDMLCKVCIRVADGDTARTHIGPDDPCATNRS